MRRILVQGDLIEVRRLRGGWERARAYIVIEGGKETFAIVGGDRGDIYGIENWRYPLDPDSPFESGSQ